MAPAAGESEQAPQGGIVAGAIGPGGVEADEQQLRPGSVPTAAQPPAVGAAGAEVDRGKASLRWVGVAGCGDGSVMARGGDGGEAEARGTDAAAGGRPFPGLPQFLRLCQGGDGGLATADGVATSVTYGFLKALLENVKGLTPQGW